MDDKDLIADINKLKDTFNLFRFNNKVLQNYNCEFQPMLSEMIERFTQKNL